MTRSCASSGCPGRRRLLDEDVERGAADLPALERLEQRGLVDDAAARAFTSSTPFFILAKRVVVDEALGLRS